MSVLFASAMLGAAIGIYYPSVLLLSSVGIALFVIGVLFIADHRLRVICVIGLPGLITASLGAWSIQQFETHIATLPKSACVFDGVVEDAFTHLDQTQSILFHANSYSCAQQLPARQLTLQLALVETAATLHLNPGEHIRVSGKIRAPAKSLSPGAFDAYWYSFSRHLDGKITVSNRLAISPVKAPIESAWLAKLRQTLRTTLSAQLLPREAALLLAVILGETGMFDDAQYDIYRQSGTQHVLAVSGLQVSLFAVVTFEILLSCFVLIPFLGRRSRARPFAAWGALILVWFFVLLCGAPPSAVRAALMATAFLVGYLVYFPVSLIDAVGIAGCITLLIYPESCVSPGFLLSYGTVIGLLSVREFKASSRSHLLNWICKLMLTSLAATLLLALFTDFLFAQIVPLSFLVNMVVIPLSSVMQLFAIVFAIAGVGFSVAPLSQVGAWLAGTIEALCETTTTISSVIRVTPLKGIEVALLFIMLLILLLNLARGRWKISFATFVAAASLCAFASFEWHGGLRIAVLPVGHGDATVFSFPDGKHMLIDAGGNIYGHFDPGKSIVEPYLLQHRIRTIDVAVISHPDPDHILGMFAIFDDFKVKSLWYNADMAEHPLMARLLEKAKDKGTAVRAFSAPKTTLNFGGASIDVFVPSVFLTDNKSLRVVNNHSLVMLFSYAGHRALWTGDIEHPAEEVLLAHFTNWKADLVKAPHHGSKTSSTEDFVTATHPQHIIFSVDDGNQWGFPHSQVLNRWLGIGAHPWITGKDGELTFWMEPSGIGHTP